MKTDWREDIKGHDSLFDIDPVQMLIFVRHQYLDCAKDLMTRPEEWDDFGEMICRSAEKLQDAIEEQFMDQEILR